MPALGELERAVMEVLWAAGEPRTAKQVQDALADRSLATTTVLTVLTRLQRKGFVGRSRDGRAHGYHAVRTREAHLAELMREAMSTAPDRGAVLASFLGGMAGEERETLRKLLRRKG